MPGFRTLTVRAAGLSLIVAVSVVGLVVTGADAEVSGVLRAVEPAVKRIARIFSSLGNGYPYLIPSLGAALAFRYLIRIERIWRWSAMAFIGATAAGLSVNILKVMFWRVRPWNSDSNIAGRFFEYGMGHSFSFPSGHAAMAGAVATLLASLMPRAWWPVLALAASLIAVSRIVLGSHYPGDAIGGLAVGYIAASFVQEFFRVRGWYPHDAGQAFGSPAVRVDRAKHREGTNPASVPGAANPPAGQPRKSPERPGEGS